MIDEEAATGKVAEIYGDIQESFGIDFVPNMYNAMARNPAYLEASWNKIRALMSVPASWMTSRRPSVL